MKMIKVYETMVEHYKLVAMNNKKSKEEMKSEVTNEEADYGDEGSVIDEVEEVQSSSSEEKV